MINRANCRSRRPREHLPAASNIPQNWVDFGCLSRTSEVSEQRQLPLRKRVKPQKAHAINHFMIALRSRSHLVASSFRLRAKRFGAPP
jgi:hypothetical protein